VPLCVFMFIIITSLRVVAFFWQWSEQCMISSVSMSLEAVPPLCPPFFFFNVQRFLSFPFMFPVDLSLLLFFMRFIIPTYACCPSLNLRKNLYGSIHFIIRAVGSGRFTESRNTIEAKMATRLWSRYLDVTKRNNGTLLSRHSGRLLETGR